MKRNCSATRRVRSRARGRADRWGSFARPTGVRCSWTRSATCRSPFRRSSSDSWTTGPFVPWEGDLEVVDVLLVSATNATLGDSIAKGRFRSDLLFRTQHPGSDATAAVGTARRSTRRKGSAKTTRANSRMLRSKNFELSCTNGETQMAETLVLCGGVRRPGAESALQLALEGRSSNITLKLEDISKRLVRNVPNLLIDLVEIAT